MATAKKKTTATKKKSTAKKSTSAAKTASKTTTKKASAKKTTAKKTVAKKVEAKTTAKKVSKPIFETLNRWNFVLAFLHAIQAVAVIVLSSDRLLPLTTNYLTLDTLASTDEAPVLVQATRNVADVNAAYIVAAFFAMSALAHLYIATTRRKKYEADLENGINRTRWFEYSLSASTMIVAIGMLAGISDISTLALMFGATAVMNLLGLVMEVVNSGQKKINWLSYNVGVLAGILPWLAFVIYIWGSSHYGQSGPPTFVYYILASIFIAFNTFAINMYLQYKKIGRWADYFYGEKTYMILSLVAKSLLAWQVYAGLLRP